MYKEIEEWLFSFNEDVLCLIKCQVQVCEAALRVKHMCRPDVIVKRARHSLGQNIRAQTLHIVTVETTSQGLA